MRAIARPMPEEPPVTSAARSIWVVYQEGNTPWSANIAREGALWVPSSPQEGGGFGRRLRSIRRVTSLSGLAAGGGCAAKYSAASLEELLRGFVPVEAENLLIG